MVAAESAFEIPEYEEGRLITAIWYNLSPGRPWWQRLWFQFYLWLVRFSYRKMGIGAPSAMLPDGTIIFRDVQGFYTDEAAAEAFCKAHNEFWSHRPIPIDVPLGEGHFQYKGRRRYPASTMPDRYRRKPFPVLAAPLNDLAIVKRNLDYVSKAATGKQ